MLANILRAHLLNLPAEIRLEICKHVATPLRRPVPAFHPSDSSEWTRKFINPNLGLLLTCKQTHGEIQGEAVHAMTVLIMRIKEDFQRQDNIEIFFSKVDTIAQMRDLVVAIPKSYFLMIGSAPLIRPSRLYKMLEHFLFDSCLYLQHVEIQVYDDRSTGFADTDWDSAYEVFKNWEFNYPTLDFPRTRIAKGKDDEGSHWYGYKMEKGKNSIVFAIRNGPPGWWKNPEPLLSWEGEKIFLRRSKVWINRKLIT